MTMDFFDGKKQNQPIFTQFPVHFIRAVFHFIVALLNSVKRKALKC